MSQSLSNQHLQPQTSTAFYSDIEATYPCDYAKGGDIPPEPTPSKQTSKVTSLRPFLKEGSRNPLISFCFMNRPHGKREMYLTVKYINQVISPALGIHRKTLIRQLEEMEQEGALPPEEQNPYISVVDVGEKKRGQTNQRYFIVTFKQKKFRPHVRRYYESILSPSAGEHAPSSVNQVLAAYENETERLEEGNDVCRLRGKDLARRTGFSLSTIRRAQKRLRDEGKIEAETTQEKHMRDKYYYNDGIKGDLKCRVTRNRCRTTYRAANISSVGVIAQNETLIKRLPLSGKIFDFTKKGFLNSAGTSPVKSAPRQKPSQPFSQFQNAWEAYEKIFTPKEGESLRQSLGAAKKYGVPLPTPERMMEALERSKEIPYLKLARRVGFSEAEKAELLAKGGTLNDSSLHWKKDIQGKNARLGFLWILKHTEDILAGKYDRQELSEKAKGRVWGEDGPHPAPNAPVKRTEVPTEWFNGYLGKVTSQKDLGVLLMRLWKKCGWSTYETLIDPCEMVKNEDGKWVLRPPNRFHAKLLEEKLTLHWWRVVRPTTNNPVRSKLREAYDAWLKENPPSQALQEEKAEDDASDSTENITTSRKEERGQEMGIVPANDDEGVIPAYVGDDAPHQSGQMPPHMGGRAEGQNLADNGRESEEALLRLKRERQERMLKAVVSCTNMHCSARSLRAHTIEQYGISAYQCWFDRCKIKVVEDVARYVAPSDFIGYEIERRYEVILENYTAKGDEITVKRKKEKL